MSSDGLVFYDQFGRLRPYQIALVSIGVAVLLLGVWVVSAIQPTGQGGVDVGTWVEEEDELDTNDQSPLLGGDHFTEPAEIGPASPQDRHTPLFQHSSMLSNPLSPRPPMSPATRARFRNRGPRYGTLIPDLVHAGAPTGFAIGLGVSSPGFVLRPGSMSMTSTAERSGSGTNRRFSRSEGPTGIEAIMSGQVGVTGLTDEGRGNVENRENREEETLREWERPGEVLRRERWWKRFWPRAQRRIKLDEQEEAG